MVFKYIFVLVLWTKVASVLEGSVLSGYTCSILTRLCLEINLTSVIRTCHTFDNSFGENHSKLDFFVFFLDREAHPFKG